MEGIETIAALEYESDVAALAFLRAEQHSLDLLDERKRLEDEYTAAAARAAMLHRQFIALRIAYLDAKVAVTKEAVCA